MSGGEQQMLTVARKSGAARRALGGRGAGHRRADGGHDPGAQGQGVSILLSEQNLHFAELVSDRAYVLEKGQIRYQAHGRAGREEVRRDLSAVAPPHALLRLASARFMQPARSVPASMPLPRAATACRPAGWAAAPCPCRPSPPACKPGADCALIVVDVQNCFVARRHAAVARAPRWCRSSTSWPRRSTTSSSPRTGTPGPHLVCQQHPGKSPSSIKLSYGHQVLWPDHCVQGTEDAALLRT
jgi:hypothetical protein